MLYDKPQYPMLRALRRLSRNEPILTVSGDGLVRRGYATWDNRRARYEITEQGIALLSMMT